MRIISGTRKGRRLETLRGRTLRPTSDRVKESLFNILGREVEDKVIIDLFAGTGNLGIEALSRGARKVIFVEKQRQAIRFIKKNLTQLGMETRSEILPMDAIRSIDILQERRESFDLILMDPPYGRGLIQRTLKKLTAQNIYRKDSILIIEHTRREPLPDMMEGWDLVRQRRIGNTMISFLTPQTGCRLAQAEDS